MSASMSHVRGSHCLTVRSCPSGSGKYFRSGWRVWPTASSSVSTYLVHIFVLLLHFCIIVQLNSSMRASSAALWFSSRLMVTSKVLKLARME
nr:hypothetical protein HmN_000747300 [Hymenolepis microstoma]